MLYNKKVLLQKKKLGGKMMSEKISTELLKAMNEIADNETKIYKIEASIFIRTSQDIVNEKVAYLYNLLKIEAKNYSQKHDDYFDDLELIISHFKQKLNMVYDEFYCQYVNIQNELQEARNNRRIVMINFQSLINAHQKDNIVNFNEKKEELIKKNNQYKEIIEKCNLQFEESRRKFEEMTNSEFLLSSKSLQIITEQNFIQRLFSKITSIFTGKKKYSEIIKEYNKIVNNIDSHELVEKMREDTIEFVAEILEMKDVEEEELNENARIGGINEG